DEGGVVPLIFGTCKVPVQVIHFGLPETQQDSRKVGGILGFGRVTQVLGHRYYVPLQLALCHGRVDQLVDIYFGDTALSSVASPIASPNGLPVSVSEEGKILDISALNMYGGDEFEGGIAGKL